MRKLIKTVDLRFFQDNAHGEYGVTHVDTFAEDNGFNAFWDGMGLFHDVWEHAHEYKDRYFKGEYAMNIGGEMAAMGAMWYYVDSLGLYFRLRQGSIYSPGDMMRQTTEDLVSESIKEGNCNFGYTLESNVPKQNETENSELECQLDLFWDKVKDLDAHEAERGQYSYQNERDAGLEFKQSVTKEKIQDLHRYGYRMAERLVPNTNENHATLRTFLEFWSKFCKDNKAEDLANYLSRIEFKIYRDGDSIQWKAEFIPSPGVPADELDMTEHGRAIKSWELAA